MKYRIFITSLLLLCLSCSKENNPSQNVMTDTKEMITFTASMNTLAEVETKAGGNIQDLDTLKKYGLGVYIKRNIPDTTYYTEKPRIEQLYLYNSTTKRFEAPYYPLCWETEGTYDFYATNRSYGFLFILQYINPITFWAYNLRPTEDLVFAKALNRKKSDGTVRLNFEHIKGGLAILAKKDNPNYNVKITDLTLSTPTSMTYTPSTNIWTWDESTSEKYAFDWVIENRNTRTLETTYPTETNYLRYLSREESEADNIIRGATLIPNRETKLTITWKILSKAGSVIETKTKEISITPVQGKISILRLNFTYTEEKADMKFTVSVVEWEDKQVTVTDPVE